MVVAVWVLNPTRSMAVAIMVHVPSGMPATFQLILNGEVASMPMVYVPLLLTASNITCTTSLETFSVVIVATFPLPTMPATLTLIFGDSLSTTTL